MFQNTQRYPFPSSNSISKADSSYFHIIHKEGHWKRQSQNRNKEDNENELEKSTQTLSSNSISQAYREYFNIIKTGDVLSHFIKVKSDQIDVAVKKPEGENSEVRYSPSAKIPHFLHHIVYSKSGSPVLGLFWGKESKDEDF